MPCDLADRLRTLAAAADAGDLPGSAAAALVRACDRSERDRRIAEAARLAGGAGELLSLLRRDGWRLTVWQQRGRAPAGAHPALLALFAAWPLPTERHLRRIINGHAVSADPWDIDPQ